jgi:DNA-binding NarL/FixJ family response regulator
MSQVPQLAPTVLGTSAAARRAARGSRRPVPRSHARTVLVVGEGELLVGALGALVREAGMEARTCSVLDLVADRRFTPDLAILGPGSLTQILESAAAVRGLHPDIPLVAIVGEADATTIAVATRAGFAGLLDVHAEAPELLSALRRVGEGSTVYPATVVRHRRAEAAASLSDRQRDVLRLVAEGRTNAEIADELMLSVNTVKFHVRSIFRALRIGSRVEAALAWASLEHDPIG